ncbi:MAG: GntR family transcriptional regulator [Candidatus Nanopelagicaceae bacterium]|nr:GntR family transcriptional regulator [Candidatus Nanopelagicaceae bacterium]
MVSRPLGAVSSDTFATLMTNKSHLPLRIAVYDKIAAAIRTGILLPSQLLPPEAELGSAFGVSRTVMREALILLEEDGLIRTQRGIGRFVVDVLPKVGIEEIHPIEQILRLPGGVVKVKRLSAGFENTTDFTKRGLGLQDGASVLMWESVVLHDGRNVALAQEWVPGEIAGVTPMEEILSILKSKSKQGTSMLNALMTGIEERLGPGTCELSVSNAGAHRARILDVTDSSPVMLLSQTVYYQGAPLFVGKYIFKPEVGHFTVIQS